MLSQKREEQCKRPPQYSNVNKLVHRREAHLLNFVYERAHDPEYTQGGNRNLRRFEAPILKELKSNNNNFERSIIFQGSLVWNRQPVKDRNTAIFKKRQKCKLNALLPYT